MKAIWLEDGVITNILLNEACSSGCGSFLENFASSLHIPTKEIAKKAFASKNPAVLGSRCTVFMNSSIITEQRNGKNPEDIMDWIMQIDPSRMYLQRLSVCRIWIPWERGLWYRAERLK